MRKILNVLFVFILLPSFVYSEESAKNAISIKKLSESDHISVDLREADAIDALRLICEASSMNVFADESAKGKTVTLQLRDVTIDEAINMIISTTGLAYQKYEGTLIVATLDKLKLSAKGQQTKIISLKYTDAVEAKDYVKNRVTDEADIQINKSANALIITDISVNIEKIEELLAEIDIPPKQVILEAKVIELESSVLKNLGISWGTSIGTALTEPVAFTATGINLTQPVTFVKSPLQMQAILSMLEQQGKANIITNSKISTINNHEATIDVLDKVPYPIRTIDAQNRETISMATADVGVSLKITPTINADGYITTKIKPKVSSILEFTGPNKDFPRVVTREAETTVRVKDSDTIILGGLLRNEERITENKVPFLGSIPLLGELFTTRRKDKTDFEIIIMITPHLSIEEK
ncbi:MAG: secretin N-terminal domain-containing protein [Candidatus Firestonebacteria bacterium]